MRFSVAGLATPALSSLVAEPGPRPKGEPPPIPGSAIAPMPGRPTPPYLFAAGERRLAATAAAAAAVELGSLDPSGDVTEDDDDAERCAGEGDAAKSLTAVATSSRSRVSTCKRSKEPRKNNKQSSK